MLGDERRSLDALQARFDWPAVAVAQQYHRIAHQSYFRQRVPQLDQPHEIGLVGLADLLLFPIQILKACSPELGFDGAISARGNDPVQQALFLPAGNLPPQALDCVLDQLRWESDDSACPVHFGSARLERVVELGKFDLYPCLAEEAECRLVDAAKAFAADDTKARF
jgi:hypothetical protein